MSEQSKNITYLTVLRINDRSLRDREYTPDFSSGDYFHKWTTSQFGQDRVSANILYRIDQGETDTYLYVQSNTPLRLKNVERAGMRLKSTMTIEYTDETIKIEEKIHNRFNDVPEVRTHEIKKDSLIKFNILGYTAKTPSGAKNPVFIEDPHGRRDWITNRLSCLTGIKVREDRQTTVKGAHEHKLRGAELTGYGIVTDPKMLYQLITYGIGKGKNYGFGLLLVA